MKFNNNKNGRIITFPTKTFKYDKLMIDASELLKKNRKNKSGKQASLCLRFCVWLFTTKGTNTRCCYSWKKMKDS